MNRHTPRLPFVAVGDHRDLDEHALSAHCVVRIRLYGNEAVRIDDIRGDVAATADGEVVFKNLRITGPLPRLLAAFEMMAALVSDAIDNPDVWDAVPGRRRRQGKSVDDWGPFVTTLERSHLRAVDDRYLRRRRCDPV